MSAREAAAELGVKLPTLYSYVSRGLVRSEAAGGAGRGRRYRVEDVRRLKERSEGRRDPERVARGALDWGMPVMESGISLISGGRLYYRGRDAIELASRGWDVEEVAALIWTGDPADAVTLFGPDKVPEDPRTSGSISGLAPFEGLGLLLTLAASRDPGAYDLRPRSVARTGARILCLMARFAAGWPEGGASIVSMLARGWAVRNTDLLRAVLILCADHELNVSAFTARCVASSGATPHAAVAAGLCALSGTRHGGQVELVEAMLDEAGRSGAREAISGRLRCGEKVPGFGHSLYPDGDPRGACLLRLTAEACPRTETVALAGDVAEEALGLLDERPTVDFGLAVLARSLGLPPGAALMLFALGRTAGWIGHAIEQYEGGALIRPRARYVGKLPEDLESTEETLPRWRGQHS